ncbi:CpsD/CapB family tyrosine-protein kinase [bacterium]|nr:CpsD/CapB family tyrosine-protein kinase [bacterium]
MQKQTTPSTKAKIAGILAETGRTFAGLQATLKGLSNPTIVISSAVAGEGKSIFTAGLGIVAARNMSGKVLLIDCNWHAPTLHSFFDINPQFTFENGIENGGLQQHIMPTSYANLELLPAPINREKLETTKSALSLIRALKDSYALTIIDTPAILAANRHMVDPIAIAANSNGIALTVLANKTPRQLVKKAQTMLEVSGSRTLGLIVNQYCNPLAS